MQTFVKVLLLLQYRSRNKFVYLSGCIFQLAFAPNTPENLNLSSGAPLSSGKTVILALFLVGKFSSSLILSL